MCVCVHVKPKAVLKQTHTHMSKCKIKKLSSDTVGSIVLRAVVISLCLFLRGKIKKKKKTHKDNNKNTL